MAEKRGNERGSALVYILIAIALLAALTMTFMQPSSQQAQSGNTFKSVSEIQSQIDFIRAIVQECVLTYPGGAKDIDIVTDDPDANKRYPIRPNSPPSSDLRAWQHFQHPVHGCRDLQAALCLRRSQQ